MDLIHSLEWRYAAKRMSGKTVSKEKLDHILEAIRLSASSLGLQPYTVLVVQSPEMRKKAHTAINQPQVLEGSDLLVFAAWDDITEASVEDYINYVASERGVPLESLTQFRDRILGLVKGRSPEFKREWAARQAYIALGTGLIAAAVEHVDATPMEGFNSEALDGILGLREKGLRSVVLLALGYRDETNDFLVKAKKVRRKKEKLFQFV